MSKNVILIGFMGCGKTSVGIRLSYQMRRAFLDTDKLIERRAGMTISEIFEKDGEAYFRKLETETLKGLLTEEGDRVISTGGGLPTREENRALLKKLGTVVYLKLSAQTVYERLRGDTQRPLLQCDDPLGKIQELMAAREAMYTAAADVTVDVDGRSFEAIIKEIEEKTA